MTERARKMLKGSCLCGGVQFEISGQASGISQCHCSLCRKASGTAAIATFSVPAGQLKWLSGEDIVKTFERPSGYGNTFCSVCGSPVPDADAKRTRFSIPAGLLDGDPPLRVTQHIFMGSMAEWEKTAAEAPHFDEFLPK